MANKKSQFQPQVKMGMKTVDKNIDKKNKPLFGCLMQLSPSQSILIFMALGCVFRPESFLDVLIDVLVCWKHNMNNPDDVSV